MKVPEGNKVPPNQAWYWYLGLIVSTKISIRALCRPLTLWESEKGYTADRNLTCHSWFNSQTHWIQTYSDFQFWPHFPVLGFLGPYCMLSPIPQLDARLCLRLGLGAN